jgi:hypothetical protein
MNDRKIIMLDMDGVINSSELINKWFSEKDAELKEIYPDDLDRYVYVKKEYAKTFKHCTELIFPELANILHNIIEQTDAYIVWSSTWRNVIPYKRNIECAREMLIRHNIQGDRLIDYTPNSGGDDYYCYRGNEIAAWLEKNSVKKCAILDDREDAGVGIPDHAKLFLTSAKKGLTEEIAKEVIKYLNEK